MKLAPTPNQGNTNAAGWYMTIEQEVQNSWRKLEQDYGNDGFNSSQEEFMHMANFKDDYKKRWGWYRSYMSNNSSINKSKAQSQTEEKSHQLQTLQEVQAHKAPPSKSPYQEEHVEQKGRGIPIRKC
jgi:hypothetical protein